MNIVIVGGGVAGLEIATQLGDKLGSSKEHAITLIDKDSAHIWKPILHTIAAGTNDLYQQQVSFIAHANQHHFTYWPGEMSGLDRQAKKIYLKAITMPDGTLLLDKRSLDYDLLIIAVGSCANDFNIPGVASNCYFIDSRLEADSFNRHLRMHLFRCATHDDTDMTISVVGGGATGVELVAELVQLIEIAESYRFSLNKKIKINLIESGNRILSAFPEKISLAVEEQLKKLGINLLLNTQVVSAEKEGFRLADGQLIGSAMMVWAAGVKAPPFLKNLDGLETTTNNLLCVKPTLQTTLDDHIFAVGDCASCPGTHNRPLPPTAQVAHQQAKHLINEIPRWLMGKELTAFHYHYLGGIVPLGKYNAFGSLGKYGIFPGGFVQGWLAQLSYDFIYRSHQTRLHGFIRGYLLWISEHINKLLRPSIRLD